MILPKKMLCVWNSSSATMVLLSFIISFMFSDFREIIFLLWLYNCRISYIKFHRTNVSYNITDNNENNNNIE